MENFLEGFSLPHQPQRAAILGTAFEGPRAVPRTVKAKKGFPEMLFFFFLMLGPYPQHMEVPKLGVESELQPPAYATATATADPSRICDLQLAVTPDP